MKKYLVLSAIAVAMSVSQAWALYQLDFDGYYRIIPGPLAPGSANLGNWSLAANNATVSAQGIPGVVGEWSIQVTMSANGAPPAYADLTIQVPVRSDNIDDQVTFNWVFDKKDPTGGGSNDRFVWLLDGVETQLTTSPGSTIQLLPDAGAHTIGWRIYADGDATLTINNFSAPTAVPEAANTAMLLASSLVGLIALRRRIS